MWQPLTKTSSLHTHLTADPSTVHLVRARHEVTDAIYNDVIWRGLAPKERARADRLIDPKRGREWAVARAALRHILAEAIGARDRPLAPRFGAGAHGKPFLESTGESTDRDIRFNLSHSGAWALVAITNGVEVGVDIERREVNRPTPALAKYAFSRLEFERWSALDEEEQPDAFYRLWTRKEAYIKLLGKGLHLDLKSFDISHEAHDVRLLAARHEDASDKVCFASFDVDEDHQGALAIRGERDALERISYWEWSPVANHE